MRQKRKQIRKMEDNISKYKIITLNINVLNMNKNVETV